MANNPYIAPPWMMNAYMQQQQQQQLTSLGRDSPASPFNTGSFGKPKPKRVPRVKMQASCIFFFFSEIATG